MISQLIDILSLNDFYGETKTIDFAKGRNELPSTWKSTLKWIKRLWYGRKNNH